LLPGLRRVWWSRELPKAEDTKRKTEKERRKNDGFALKHTIMSLLLFVSVSWGCKLSGFSVKIEDDRQKQSVWYLAKISGTRITISLHASERDHALSSAPVYNKNSHIYALSRLCEWKFEWKFFLSVIDYFLLII